MPWRESPQQLARARAERPVVIPTPLGALYGIYTPPDPDAPAAGLTVIHFTRPRSHRNRMWVEGARRLAARGFACFRFDYHGTGDSEGESAFLDPNQPYRDDALAVMRHLREHCGARRFVLTGSCFDARTALSTLAEEGEAVEGLAFIAAPVMELSTMVRVDADQRTWKHVTFALLKPENWRAMVRADRWKYVGTILSRMMRRSVAGPADDYPLSPGFREDFAALVRSQAKALFLYGEEDPEYQSFRVAERTLFPALPDEVRARFEVVVWPGIVHGGFLDMTRQREIFRKAIAWIEALHPRAASLPAVAEPVVPRGPADAPHLAHAPVGSNGYPGS
jgi:pimeloyl-ACP methyl ester carboxylesterase